MTRSPVGRSPQEAARAAQRPSMLEVIDISVYYGPVRAVSGVSFDVREREVVGLLGANGAGKSTVLKAISGIVKARSGSVRYLGRELSAVSAPARVRMGLVQVPEGRRLFPALTVRENLELAALTSKRPIEDSTDVGGKLKGAVEVLWRRSKSRRKEMCESVLERFPLLKPHLRTLAGMLSGGEQQVLAIARAMMANPKLLMVDEPSLGLAPQMVDSVYELLVEIPKTGTSVLLVEQNVSLALEVTERAVVLQNGSCVLSGTSSELAGDSRVVDAYLGSSARVELPGNGDNHVRAGPVTAGPANAAQKETFP